MNVKRHLISLAAIALLLITTSSFGYAADNTELQRKLQTNIKAGQQIFYNQNYAEAERVFTLAAEQAKELGNTGLYAYSCAYLGFAKIYLNKADEAEALLKQAEKDSTDSNTPIARTLTDMALIEHFSRRGDIATQQKYIKAILSESDSSFSALLISKEGFRKMYTTTQWLQKGLSELKAPSDTDDYFEDALVKHKVIHWNEGHVIKVYAPEANAFKGWNPEYGKSFRKACQVWQNILENKIQFQFVNKSSDADVIVTWHVDNRVQTGGTFYSRYGNTLANADIEFHLIDNTNQFIEPDGIYKISLHELAHLLGIVGHSRNPSDIMFPNLTYIAAPSARDIATMRKLYQTPADITNPSGKTLSQYRQELLAKKKYPVPVLGHFYH